MDPHWTPTDVEDHLDRDPPLRNQHYCCVSFMLPRDAMADAHVFRVGRYLRACGQDVEEMLKSVERLGPKAKELARNVRTKHAHVLDEAALQEDFRSFEAQFGAQLDEEYEKLHGRKMDVVGVKFRGAYNTQQEAEQRCAMLRDLQSKTPNANDVHIYVAEVGAWLSMCPRSNQVEDEVFAEAQLNTIMKNHKENAQMSERTKEEWKKQVASGVTPANQALMGGEDPWLARKKPAEPAGNRKK